MCFPPFRCSRFVRTRRLQEGTSVHTTSCTPVNPVVVAFFQKPNVLREARCQVDESNPLEIRRGVDNYSSSPLPSSFPFRKKPPRHTNLISTPTLQYIVSSYEALDYTPRNFLKEIGPLGLPVKINTVYF